MEHFENLSGINIDKPPIHVRHADLERQDNSSFRSDCPACKVGSIPVRRNMETMEIEPIDNCLLCGQTVVYDDFIEAANKKIAERLTPDLMEKLRKLPLVPWNGED